ncbi:DUF2790 domain-containing protein [Pseudomonas serbica]|jgi:hypothetical protein|uniref:DUF2790 domain-containing protein n=1 Tax=Pseudomonas serbica TaxID=2965074 RepID=UPI00237A3C04|nr:DUF2790 domain-containing protein [Pseudomonas serbica]
MKFTYTMGAVVIATISAFAHADQDSVHPPAIPYNYTMNLDVAEVIAMDEPDPADCRVVEAYMTYSTTEGSLQRISYRKFAQSCNSQN